MTNYVGRDDITRIQMEVHAAISGSSPTKRAIRVGITVRALPRKIIGGRAQFDGASAA
jgi:hypothetical protein